MSKSKKTPPVELVYSGGLDGVVIHFPTDHVVTFERGVPVEVCADDAKALEPNPDFQVATNVAASIKASEEADK
tara:strand:+ start:1172 stop:1393 length:222 start_codon:yes stop_codon:yes gene_type:complete